jgi:hypothetical protein
MEGAGEDHRGNSRFFAARSGELAAGEVVTLRTLVERGLHRVVAENKQGTPFKLRCEIWPTGIVGRHRGRYQPSRVRAS